MELTAVLTPITEDLPDSKEEFTGILEGRAHVLA
jgi:hypothetical protein